MKNLFYAFVALLLSGVGVSGQTSLFTYQGRLVVAGNPASGDFDVRFTLHDTLTQSNQLGGTMTIAPLTVSNGLFTTTLDFGSGVFDGNDRWLQIAVRPLGDTNAHVVLSPRQRVTSAPYAIRALNAGSASSAVTATTLIAPLPSTNISGKIPVSNLPTNVALLNTNATFSGALTATQFNGSGAGLFNVPATSLTGTIPDQRLPTNVALLNANANFSGTVTATNFSGYGGGLSNVPGRLFDNIPIGSPSLAFANTGYLATNDTVAVVLTLPTAIKVGETVRISGSGSGGWIVAQNAGQSILVANLLDNVGMNWTPRDSDRDWKAIASSTDGKNMVAVVNGGFIYTSTNTGVTWTNQTGSGSRNWSCVASSGDGTKLVAAVNGERIYTSTDSGVSWTLRDSSRNWSSVASSLDGTRLVATVNSGQIYTSVNSGVNWTARLVNSNWTSVASSADGLKLAAANGSGKIHISVNGGTNWTTNGPANPWSSIASSYDGSRLVATVPGPAPDGAIYVSSDSGTTWTPTGISRDWSCVSSSADGARLAAASTSGEIVISTDSGATWQQAVITPSGLGWTGVTVSGDGSTAAAVANANKIYVSSQPTTTPGTAGYLSGTRQAAIDLIYIGNGQFMPVTHIGSIRAH